MIGATSNDVDTPVRTRVTTKSIRGHLAPQHRDLEQHQDRDDRRHVKRCGYTRPNEGHHEIQATIP